MAKRIPEKYINGGMLIGFIILMGIIGYGIWDGTQWQCVKTETIKQVWEDTKLVLSKVVDFNQKGLNFNYGE